MGKKILLLVLLIGPVTMTALAQYSGEESEIIEEAEEFFKIEDYFMTFQLLTPVVKVHVKDARLNYMMGVSGFNLHTNRNTGRAYLAKAAEMGYAQAYLPYARALLYNNRLYEALEYIKKVEQNGVEAEAAEAALIRSWINNALTMMQNPVAVQVEPLGTGVNSEFIEHTPVISQNDSTLYFTSRRPMLESSVTDLNGQYDENIYVSQRTDAGWSMSKPIDGNVNDLLNEATVSLQAKGDRMLIFKTNRDLETSDLWTIRKKDEEWKTDDRLKAPINSKWTENSAAINTQGNAYYIASDRPGGYGGMDIYRVVVFGNGDLSEPLNLGPTINSAFDETAPFLLPDDHTFFFSSNRPQSMGGYDIFQCKLLHDTVWSTPENLGYPLNTTEDDLHISVAWKGGTAYFTRASAAVSGDFDICQSNLPGFNISANVYKGRVVTPNVTGLELSMFSDDFSELLGVYSMNEAGEFLVVLLPGDVGILEVRANGYEVFEMPLQYKEHEGILEVPLMVELKPEGQ